MFAKVNGPAEHFPCIVTVYLKTLNIRLVRGSNLGLPPPPPHSLLISLSLYQLVVITSLHFGLYKSHWIQSNSTWVSSYTDKCFLFLGDEWEIKPLFWDGGVVKNTSQWKTLIQVGVGNNCTYSSWGTILSLVHYHKITQNVKAISYPCTL